MGLRGPFGTVWPLDAACGRDVVVVAGGLGFVGSDGVIGLSWLVPPYRWTYDARAQEDVRAISLDATCLRGKCDADPVLGYEVMKRFMPTLVERIHNTRLQMLDVYGTRG